MGNKYVYGGTSLTKGADCSGFALALHAHFGIKLLRVSDDQMHGPSAAMQKQVLELMCSLGSVAVKELCYFTGASTATVNRLEKL